MLIWRGEYWEGIVEGDRQIYQTVLSCFYCPIALKPWIATQVSALIGLFLPLAEILENYLLQETSVPLYKWAYGTCTFMSYSGRLGVLHCCLSPQLSIYATKNVKLLRMSYRVVLRDILCMELGRNCWEKVFNRHFSGFHKTKKQNSRLRGCWCKYFFNGEYIWFLSMSTKQ